MTFHDQGWGHPGQVPKSKLLRLLEQGISQAGRPACQPTNSIKALKDQDMINAVSKTHIGTI